MAKKQFKGKNELGSRDLFNNRMLYEGFALGPDRRRPTMRKIGVRDFNRFSNIFYGKYPHDSTAVLKPKDDLLVTRDGFYMFDFVASALDDMLDSFGRAKTAQKIKRDDQYLSNPSLAAGYVDFDTQYVRVLGAFKNFVLGRIRSRGIQKDIISFEDYINVFKEAILPSVSRLPLTRSQFVLSPNVAAFSTGLTIAISGKDASIDQPKIDEFYGSPNFEFFRSNAIAYGFLIDKNVPWILTADLGSPQMRKYLQQSPASSFLLNGNFSSAYDEVAISDIEYIKNQLINFYADFVTKNPYYRIVEQGAYGEDSCPRLVRRDRTAGNADSVRNLREKYNDDYWLPFYGDVRFAESGLEVDEATKDFVINNALQISKHKGPEEAARYIQRKTFNIIAVEGSLMYESKKLDTKDLTDASNSDILDVVRREVINDKFELF